jgi:hypothetical protein
MVLDQRNAGASVTPTNLQYLTDRWFSGLTQASKYTAQQNAGAVTPPAGFTNYLGVTSSSAYSVLTGDTFYIAQSIEGFNSSDFAWGTANASPVTLSFWVRSSLTGTFGGSITNRTARSYPFSYTISSANTWTQISVTIAGDTSGTWPTNNTASVSVYFGLGSGATYSGTSGAWAGSVLIQPTSTASVVGTNGATFYITGVQLEKGSTATSFDYRPYGTEFNLCQRYFYKPTNKDESYVGVCSSTTAVSAPIQFPITMRSAPTITLATAGSASGNIAFLTSAGSYPSTIGSNSAVSITVNGFNISGSGYVASGWAAGVGTWLYTTSISSPFSASAEL